MGANDKGAVTQVPGQAPAGGSPGAAPQGEAVPQYVTLAEAQRVAREEADTAFRNAQGYADKGVDAFRKQVSQQLASLEQTLTMAKAHNVAISPEQEAALRQQVINDSFKATPTAPQQVPQAAQPGEPEGVIDPIYATALEYMEEANTYIEEGDPEFAALDKEFASPGAFLKEVQKQIPIKQARLSGKQPPSQLPTQPAQNRLPTNVGGGGAPSTEYFGKVRNPDDIWRDLQSK